MDIILAGCYPFISEWSFLNNPRQSVTEDFREAGLKFEEEYIPMSRGVKLKIGKIICEQKECQVFCNIERDQSLKVFALPPSIIVNGKYQPLQQICLSISISQAYIDDALQRDDAMLLKKRLNDIGGFLGKIV